MQISANPWSFVTADQASSFAITSIVNQGESLLVTTAAHGFTVGSQGQAISIQGTVPIGLGYNGGYRVVTVPSATTVLLVNQQKNRGLGNLGAVGNMLTVAYMDMIRAEQILWETATAGTLLLTDVSGNIVWNPTAIAGMGPYTYGKVFWIRGLVLNTIPAASVVQVTIN